MIEDGELESSIHFTLNHHPGAQTNKSSYMQRLNSHRRCSETCPMKRDLESSCPQVNCLWCVTHPLKPIGYRGADTDTLESKRSHPSATLIAKFSDFGRFLTKFPIFNKIEKLSLESCGSQLMAQSNTDRDKIICNLGKFIHPN